MPFRTRLPVLFPLSVLLLLVAAPLTSALLTAAEPIAGLGPTGPVQKVFGGLQFTEGPAWDGQNTLYFSDIPANHIYAFHSDRPASDAPAIFADASGHTNGLMFAGDGALYACSMDGALVAFDIGSGEQAVLAGRYRGERFNAPNDLVIDRTGGVYFTDPRFRAPSPLPQGIEAVYYRAADGKVTRIISDLDGKAPNGVILSPDEATLYIVCSMQAEVMAYPVQSPGQIGAGTAFATLNQPAGKSGNGGDGLTVDAAGNLYITTGLGLQVVSPEGKVLGVIELPEQPANATFGGPDGKTLFATARTGLYAVPMEVRGHVFSGKSE